MATPHPVDSEQLPWIPIRRGLSWKPLRFFRDDAGWMLLLRIEPGTLIPRHRHTGAVHGFNLRGQRKLLDTGELVGPGGYVYEPPGNVDSWMAVGETPVVVHITVYGAIEHLGEGDEITRRLTATTEAEAYRRHCLEHDLSLLDLQE